VPKSVFLNPWEAYSTVLQKTLTALADGKGHQKEQKRGKDDEGRK